MDYILKSIDYYSPDHKGLYNGIAQLTNSINDTYPDLNDWLQKKFFPGLKDGSRKIVVAYNDLNNPMGIALLKDTPEEKKICCLFVREDYRGLGIANNLIKKSFAVLKTNKPLITVADTHLSQLQRLLDKNHFTFSYKKKGAYKESNTENYFNNEATDILKNKILPALLTYKENKR